MKKLILIALLVVPTAFAESEPAPAPVQDETVEAAPAADSTAAEGAAETTQAQPPEPTEAMPPRPRSTGSLRETVTETMRMFTPSESIDVDKPVDFPANI